MVSFTNQNNISIDFNNNKDENIQNNRKIQYNALDRSKSNIQRESSNIVYVSRLNKTPENYLNKKVQNDLFNFDKDLISEAKFIKIGKSDFSLNSHENKPTFFSNKNVGKMLNEFNNNHNDTKNNYDSENNILNFDKNVNVNNKINFHDICENENDIIDIEENKENTYYDYNKMNNCRKFELDCNKDNNLEYNNNYSQSSDKNIYIKKTKSIKNNNVLIIEENINKVNKDYKDIMKNNQNSSQLNNGNDILMINNSEIEERNNYVNKSLSLEDKEYDDY